MKTEEALMSERIAGQVGCYFVKHVHALEEALETSDEQLEEVRQACLDLADAEKTIERMQESLERLPHKLQQAQLKDDDEEVARLKCLFSHAHDIVAESKAKQGEAQGVLNKYRPNALRDTTPEEAIDGVYASASRVAHKALKELEAARKAFDKAWDRALEGFKEEANRVRR